MPTQITEGLVADILQLLPPAAPGREVIERDKAGQISGVLEYQPTLPPPRRPPRSGGP
jgi:hypothetical protein